jgi:hypothetical protein
MNKTRNVLMALLAIVVIVLVQLACAEAYDLRCAAGGGEWISYDYEKNEPLPFEDQYCDTENRPKPPLLDPQPLPDSGSDANAPSNDQPAPAPEETLEPEECNQKANVSISLELNTNTVCDCAYFAQFNVPEDTIVYYHTQKYVTETPQGHRQYQKLLAGQTWTWSSETLVDGQCLPMYLDQITAFVDAPGCDNIYKTANWAIDEYIEPVEMLCTELISNSE